MHSKVVLLQGDLASKGAKITSLEAELDARKDELNALKMALLETQRMLETQQMTTLQIGMETQQMLGTQPMIGMETQQMLGTQPMTTQQIRMDGDEFSTGTGKDPCSRRARSLGAFCHPAGETADDQALKEAESRLLLEYANYEMVPVPKELQKKLCNLGVCCTLRDATSMQKRLKSSLTISLARRAAGAAPFLDDDVDAMLTSIADDMLCVLPNLEDVAELDIHMEDEPGIKDLHSQIFVKNLKGQTTTVMVSFETESVEELKARVLECEFEGLLLDQKFLSHEGKVLVDEAWLLSEYGIKEHSTEFLWMSM
jgi:hypothetical protein